MTEVWAEKFRPSTITDCVLSDFNKQLFLSFIKNEDFPNLLLYGDTGIGKTSAAKALCKDLGWDLLVINASSMRMDDFRNVVTSFVTTQSFDSTSPVKVVLLDEADAITSTIQPSLRNFMEENSKFCRFVLTANYPSKIIKAIRSRCKEICFDLKPEEKQKVAIGMMKRLAKLLEQEGVEFDQKSLSQVILDNFPDNRKIINDLQTYASISGRIDQGILQTSSLSLDALFDAFKRKNWPDVRKFCADNKDMAEFIFSKLYEEGPKNITKPSIPELILTVGEHAYRNAFVTNPEINLAACMVSLMRSCEFK